MLMLLVVINAYIFIHIFKVYENLYNICVMVVQYERFLSYISEFRQSLNLKHTVNKLRL